jgi:hypothetical protein
MQPGGCGSVCASTTRHYAGKALPRRKKIQKLFDQLEKEVELEFSFGIVNVIYARQKKPAILSALATARGLLPTPEAPEKMVRGKKPQHWLSAFIYLLAKSCAEVGITIAAERGPVRNDPKGPVRKLDGPFLRVLRNVHRQLPVERQATSESALAHYARDVVVPYFKANPPGKLFSAGN